MEHCVRQAFRAGATRAWRVLRPRGHVWVWAADTGSTPAASTCFLCSGVMTRTLPKIATTFGFSLSAPFLRLLLRRGLIVAVPL
jgi:hypothetical protein